MDVLWGQFYAAIFTICLFPSAPTNDRIKNIEDVLHEGDRVKVKVIEIDDQDRINLSMKDVDESKEK